MKETLTDRLDRIGAEAEAAEADQTDRPIPAHVKVGRPNRARSKVLQVRLNPDELDAVERIAAQRGLPASTVARERLLQMITEDQASEGDVAAQLAAAADRIKQLVGRMG
jgi:predicted DNA binding CopG/RHH family protein